jgi:hypothetical protein
LPEAHDISTGNLEDSSAGAFKIASTTPWSLRLSKPQLDLSQGCPVITGGWLRESFEGDLQHFFSFRFAQPYEATSASPIFPRLIAHLIVDQLPDQALPEVLEQLGNAWLFYQFVPPQGEPASPSSNSLKGKMIRRYERPTYSLTGEE